MADDATLSTKLVILDADRRIMLDHSTASTRLPEVQIPQFTRIAYSATLAAREKYGLDLFVILIKALGDKSGTKTEGSDSLALICRVQSGNTSPSECLGWVDTKQAAARLEIDDRETLVAALNEFERFDSGTKPSSFGRYRALDDLREWYSPYLSATGVRETGIQQWNGDPWFALFRIAVEPVGEPTEETPKALWFKAVGEPNTREFTVTKALAEECPYWFPKLIATKPEWNGWLMEEVNGHELDVEPDGRPWALTARILAKVQKRFVGQEDRLLSLGCRDWRVPRVLSCLDMFFDDMEEIMGRQQTEPPQILGASALREIKAQCQDLCRAVEDADVPYTITHGDFSPHNVIVLNGWPVLIDWAEAYVSFPFISWEYFWNRTIKDHPDYAAWHERMHRNYAYRVWASMLGRKRVDEALRLSPAMAVLVLALYGIDDPKERKNRSSDKSKRSLVRRLQRELRVVETVGSL
jgi:hypothetical protein